MQLSRVLHFNKNLPTAGNMYSNCECAGNRLVNCLYTTPYSNVCLCKHITWVYTHISYCFADNSQLSGMVDRTTQLTVVAAVWRHRLGCCNGQTETKNGIVLSPNRLFV